ncbi:MAG: hypothetical protein KBE25_08720 [Laribacter sp.]|nr:hypothetical protein [Laribacter sp.]MBP9528592.1 hypothetical protein [Laribacter sp.]MBP9609420.1 hypothetical protein [Laribacter sp.]
MTPIRAVLVAGWVATLGLAASPAALAGTPATQPDTSLFAPPAAGLVPAAASLQPVAVHGGDLRARRIGAYSGAMQWCSTLQPARAARYRLAGQRARNAMHLLPGHQRRLAHEARDHTRRSGRFMGTRLDYRQCQQLERNTRPW